jgi:hypothetical protein
VCVCVCVCVCVHVRLALNSHQRLQRAFLRPEQLVTSAILLELGAQVS